MHEPIPCPQRGAPARITERFRLGSNAGPVEHLKTGCVNHRWLMPLAETLAVPRPPSRPPNSRPPERHLRGGYRLPGTREAALPTCRPADRRRWTDR
jgi:hypothetical protein